MTGYRAAFTDNDVDAEDDDLAFYSIPVLALALVELRNGRQVLDAVLEVTHKVCAKASLGRGRADAAGRPLPLMSSARPTHELGPSHS